MKLSEIQIIPIKPSNGLVAFASLVIDDSIYLGSIGIITRPLGGYRLTYPTRKVRLRDMNIFYPINKICANTIETEVIKKFEEVMNKYDRYNSINT